MATKQANPWSVKGIETDTRETAKEAARRAGMTVGQWLNTVIQQSASELGAVRSRNQDRESRDRFALDDSVPDLDGHIGSLETRLAEMAQHLRSIQSLGALQRPADREERSPAVQRLERDVIELAEAVHSLTRRFDRSEEDARSAWSGIEQRLGSLDTKLDKLAAQKDAPAIDEDVDAITSAGIPEAGPDFATQRAMLERIESMRQRIEAQGSDEAATPSRSDDGLANTLSSLASRLEALQDHIETAPAGAGPDPEDREDRVVATVENKLRQMESSLLAVARSVEDASSRIEPASRLGEEVITDVGDKLARMESGLHAVSQAVHDVSSRLVHDPARDDRVISAVGDRLAQMESGLSQVARTVEDMSFRMADDPARDDRVISAVGDRLAQMETGLHTVARAVETATRRPDADDPVIGIVQDKLSQMESNLLSVARVVEDVARRPDPDPARDDRVIAAIEDKLAQMESGLYSVARAVDPGEVAARVASEQAGLFESLSRDQQAERSRTAAEFLDLHQAVNEIASRQVALEETVDTHKPSDFDARFDAMARRLDDALVQQHPDLHEIRDHLDNLAVIVRDAGDAPRAAMDRLAERFSSLETRVASSLESRDPIDPELSRTLGDLNRRLSTPDPRIDVMQRHLTELAAKIDRGIEARIPNIDSYGTQLQAVADRIESSMSQPRTSGIELEQIDSRLRTLADRIDRALQSGNGEQKGIASLEAKLNAIDARLARDQNAGPKSNDIAFLEAKLNAIGDRIVKSLAVPPPAPMEITALENKLNAIKDRLDKTLAQPLPAAADPEALDKRLARMTAEIQSSLAQSNPDTQAMEDRIARLIERISVPAAGHGVADPTALAAISRQLAELTNSVNAVKQSGGGDAGDLRGLEDRISELAARIDAGNDQARSIGAIEKNLNALFTRLESGQSATVEAAREAARQAIAEATANPVQSPAHVFDALQDRIRDIHDQSTQSDRHTRETLAAVHETLRDVATRIHALESGAATQPDRSTPPAEATTGQPPAQPRAKTARPPAGEKPAKPSAPPPASAAPQTPQRPPEAAAQAPSQTSAKQPEAAAQPLSQASVSTAPPAIEAAETRHLDDGARSALLDTVMEVHAQKQAEVKSKSKRRFGLPSLKLGRKQGPQEALPAAAAGPAPQPQPQEKPQAKPAEAHGAAPAQAKPQLPPVADTPVLDEKQAPAPKPQRARVVPSDAPADAHLQGKPSQTDFIAAARRAAQAAALAAEVDEERNEAAAESKSFLARLGRFRKPATYTALALILAIGGTYLYSNLTGTEETPATATTAPATEDPATEDATAASVGTDTTDVSGQQQEQAAADPAEAGASDAPVRVIETAPTTAAVTPDVGFDDLETPTPTAAIAPETAETQPQPPTAVETIDVVSVPPATSVPGAQTPPAAGDLDPQRFPEKLREAALAGDAVAQFEVAARFADESALNSDLFRAAEWYARAAGQGLAPAQYRLGSLYEKGQGVEKNLDLAKLWYERAAVQGNRKAIHNLAVLLTNEEGGSDYEGASKWFERAAQLGLADSQYNIGILRARGLGIEQNIAESYKWFALAAAQGDTDAADKRDQLAANIDEESLLAAQLAVQSWQPQPMVEAANTVAMPEGGWNDTATAAAEPAPLSLTDLVKRAQELLNANGFEVGTPDGIAGPRTASAIRAFERSAGLPETGQVSPDLLQKLSASAG